MKYKICKLQDANGNIKYQIKKKYSLFWRWIYTARGPLEIAYYEPLWFFTFEAAKDWVQKEKAAIQYYKKSQIKKIIECVEV